MSRRSKSISFRITVLFAGVATSVLLALGLLIGNAVEQHFVGQDIELLTGKTRLAANLLAQAGPHADPALLARQLEAALVGHHGLAVAVLRNDGTHLFATPDMPFTEAALRGAGAGARTLVWNHAGVPWRGLVTLAGSTADGPVQRIAVAVDISNHEQFMAAFRRTLWWLVALAAILVGFCGALVVRRELRPLQAIRKGAAAVTASHLDYRLSVEAVPVELAALAQSLNEMLARLEESFARLKDFSSDLAHELRTPISNLMTETQVALTRPRTADEYRDVLASNAEEYERLARMIGDMLFLAQADNGLIVPREESVDLGAQVRELFDFFDALADEKSLHLTLHGDARVTGDTLMLRRSLANVLANAIRHTPAAGTIRVDIRVDTGDDGTLTTVSVANSGERIAPEQASRIFDRFYRADPSRHGSGEGAGLGLAITRSIIRAHGGDITVHASDDGTCFELRLPSRRP